MRRAAREAVFKLVFEYTFYFSQNESTLELMLLDSDLSEDDKDFIKQTYSGVCAEYENLKDKVASLLENYKVDRLYRPDLVVLILACYELEKASAPKAVVINEAVELAKKYGTEKSGGFVNGVLARLCKE
jgi:N utilization substance protein B